MSDKSDKSPKPEAEAYWLPEFGVTVQASSYEEAVKKAKEIKK